MRIEKCHIAQRNTGEIVAARQVDSADDEWCCHHCQCPLIFHPATVMSPAWFEHVIPAGDPEALVHCAYLVSEDQTSSSMKQLQRAYCVATTRSAGYPLAMHNVW